MDTGEIIAQRPVLVNEDDTKITLHERIKQVEREQIVDLLQNITIEDGKARFNVSRD